jgi:heme-degrading monooxygenase HmoA
MIGTTALAFEETAMYASLRHYRIEPKNMDELVKRVPKAMEVISTLDGFKAYYVVRAGEDTLATVSVFADKAGAVLSNQAAAKRVKENAADLFSGTVDAVTGEIVAYRTSA